MPLIYIQESRAMTTVIFVTQGILNFDKPCRLVTGSSISRCLRQLAHTNIRKCQYIYALRHKSREHPTHAEFKNNFRNKMFGIDNKVSRSD